MATLHATEARSCIHAIILVLEEELAFDATIEAEDETTAL
jgi:hypothetical protein